MHLKALELAGFKSFADKTVVEFNRGITSIVGPNGSGKSNILDAILWVLGEQSYKNIRAKESSDVIFSGGKNKKAKSMAEVSLIIENEDRYLDIDFSEIKITRRIYKNGENEYFINNRKARLKDINNLFMDTGIGKQAYSIIGQGRVERIIGSNPRELKEIIEEAAGVKRAKVEKEESEKKLKEVKNEIEKITYVEKDLETRVKHLKDEGMKARLFKTYTEKIDVHKLMILEYNINEKENTKEKYTAEKENLKNIIDGIQKDFNLKQGELQESNKKRERAYEELENEKNKNFGIFKEIESLKNEYSDLKNGYSNLETEANEKQKRKTALEKDISEKSEILNNSKIELDKIIQNLSEKEKEKKSADERVERLKNKREAIISAIKEKNQENHNLEVDKFRAVNENEDLEKRINTAENISKRLINEKETAEKEFNGINDKKEEFEKKKIEKENEKNLKENEIENINIGIETLQKRYAQLNKEKNELNYKYENLNAKKRANINIIEKNETFAKSIKYILNESFDGVVGAFVNLINIPTGFEEAIQTLSGGSFQDIVVKNTDIAKKCIEILKEKKIGRASFLPVDGVKVFKIMNEFPKKDGVVDFARNIVKYDKSIEKIIQFVYGNSLVVKNLEVGTQLLKEGYNDRIVTLEGDIITARGRMTGGHSVRGKDELLERKKELNTIIENMSGIEKELERITSDIEKTNERLKQGEIKKQKKDTEYKEVSDKYKEFLEEYESFTSSFNKKKREIETLNYEINENEASINTRKQKILENKEIIKKSEEDVVKNNIKLQELNSELEKSEDLTEHLNELNKIDKEYEILKVRTENNQSRYIEIERDYQKLLSEQKELTEFEKKRDNLKEEFEKKISEKKEEIQRKNNENENLNQLIKKHETDIKNYENSERELINEIKNIEVKMVEKKNEYEKSAEVLVKTEKDLEYFNLELQNIENPNVKDNTEYKKIENDLELQAVKRKLSMNEKSRMEIGSVNLAAIDEYERENTRYNELTDQKRDLTESRESLLTLIRDIESEIVEKFSIAFEEINKNFEYMCKTILNGAKGVIRLLDSENLLETGLELSVKYKNKPEQTLLLLSGGEKSMLAVSFIMAIFMFKPSPFTFFDEIEAALDEENTKKIVKLLNRFIEKSQFILITHNKETMKGSHRLYGVTMNKEIGESRLISVDV